MRPRLNLPKTLRSDQLEIFGAGRVPRCIRAELRTCLAPCVGRPSAAEYMSTVGMARRFLEGKAEKPLDEGQRRYHAEELKQQLFNLLRQWNINRNWSWPFVDGKCMVTIKD